MPRHRYDSGPSRGWRSSVGFLELDRLRITVAGYLGGKMIGWIQHPGVPALAGKERKLADGDKAYIPFGRAALNVTHFFRKIEFHPAFRTRSRFGPFPAHDVSPIRAVANIALLNRDRHISRTSFVLARRRREMRVGVTACRRTVTTENSDCGFRIGRHKNHGTLNVVACTPKRRYADTWPMARPPNPQTLNLELQTPNRLLRPDPVSLEIQATRHIRLSVNLGAQHLCESIPGKMEKIG
jgi:hypothetical protein